MYLIPIRCKPMHDSSVLFILMFSFGNILYYRSGTSSFLVATRMDIDALHAIRWKRKHTNPFGLGLVGGSLIDPPLYAKPVGHLGPAAYLPLWHLHSVSARRLLVVSHVDSRWRAGFNHCARSVRSRHNHEATYRAQGNTAWYVTEFNVTQSFVFHFPRR